MFSIKQSFADCSQCGLLDAPSCIFESNVDELSEVEVIFIAENPGKNEVEHNPPIPLIGKAGMIFRRYFDRLFKGNFKWLLTNCVLCLTLTPDGKTGNPDNETVQRCKINCFEIIKRCNPKLIVLMGNSAKEAFGIKGQITKISGDFFKWEHYNIMTTIHPSSINQPGGKSKEPLFQNALEKAAEFLGFKFESQRMSEDNMGIKKGNKGKFLYKLSDEKFYSEDYVLIDIQYLNREKKVLYIFKDKTGKKIFHKENDNFVCYKIDDMSKANKIVSYDDLTQINIPFNKVYSDLKNNFNQDLLYESDVDICVKHAQDYYAQSKGEPDIDLNVLGVDIEIHSKGNKEFPKPEDSKYPIAMITNHDFRNDEYKVFVFDVNNENLHKKINYDYKDKNVKIFVYKTERDMMENWIKEIRREDIDIITGWYVILFDMNYIYHRLPKLGISQSSLSRFNEVYLNLYSEHFHIPGINILDGLKLYKEFTFTNLESYSLNAVSNKELGKGKTSQGSSFSKMFDEDINGAIEYNIVDVELVYELQNKLKHIFLQNELRKICKCNFKSSMTPMGRLDSLLVDFLKHKNFASKDANPTSSGKFEGAYVHPPITGCHDWVVDFDFTSLYPSIILTYNIGVNTFLMKLDDKYLGYDLMYDRDNLPEKIDVMIDPVFKNKKKTFKRQELLDLIDNDNLIYTINGCVFKQHETETSLYSEILELLLGSRKVYKKQMFDAIENKNESLKSLYDTRQQVYKILANALYGVLGNNAFRFYNLDLARTITLSGQEALKHSIIKGDEFIESLKNENILVDRELAKIKKQDMFSVNMDIVCNNIITGDTDSIFAKFEDLVDDKKDQDENVKDILNYCDLLQTFLNNDIINKMVSKRNVDLSKNRLDLKNELVIKRGLFLSKKHYGIYVIKQEGKTVDFIKDMGLDTKRSDYPSKTKEHLQELLNMILKSDKVSLNRLHKYIDSKEREFFELSKNGHKIVARPVSFSKKLEEYKVIPNGVEGMLNWNKLMYNIFNHGSRGYLFKLNGIDLYKAPKEIQERYTEYFSKTGKKLKYIVLPEEEERLPDYFSIDVNAMTKFAWKDRYNLLLEPIVKIDRSSLDF